MAWKRSRTGLARDFRDLEYLPPGRSAWDCTLSCLAYGIRLDILGAAPDLNDWASRHGVPASGSFARLGQTALVLWHGTSRERADKIQECGLFHKQGVWTARHPAIPHSFCRMRAERFGTEGAVVCLVLDRDQLVAGRDYEIEPNGNVFRFQHGLPPEVVQYVLVREEIRFAGGERVTSPSPWPRARFKHAAGQWRTVQRSPVRFSDTHSFSTLPEYARLCLGRLLHQPSGVTLLEVLSVLYSLVEPWEAVRHQDVLEMLEALSSGTRAVGKWKLFIPGPASEEP
jgi:hypothetical protein